MYPRIKQIGLKVYPKPIAHVDRKELGKALRKHKIAKIFSKFFGVQTQIVQGPYAWDVEAVLERIFSGKKTGTQKYWD